MTVNTDTEIRTEIRHDVTIPAGLADALRFVLPAMGDKAIQLHGVWLKPGPVWAGFTDEWHPQWDATVHGFSAVATDRYRLHITGVATDKPVEFTTTFLDGTDVQAALKMAPKGRSASTGATLTVDGDTAHVTWASGARLPIRVVDRDMPNVERLLEAVRQDDSDESHGYDPRFLVDALKPFGGNVRFRPSRGRKPAALAATDPDDSRAAIVMPVRLAT